MARKTEHNMQDVLDAIRGEGLFKPNDPNKVPSTFGNVSNVAKRLSVSRMAVYSYMKRWKTIGDAIKDERDVLKDFAENKIAQRMMEGSDTMLIFYAKTQMKDRGYVERHEVTGTGGGAIPISVINGDVERLK